MSTFISNENIQVRKCLKSYLTAKKYYDTDIEKSFEYFKQCKKILDDLKKNNNNNFATIIDETETECDKFITLTIETSLNKPIIKSIKSNSSLFEMIELGDITELKKYKYGEVDFNVYNEDGLTPLHYAIKFGDTSFIKLAFRLGAYIDQTNKNGYTLLEFACLERDPNIINFLELHGSDMKKHLEFREGKKYFNTGNQIDILLLEKKIIEIKEIKSNKYLDWIFNYINKDEKISIEYANRTIIKFEDLINKLDIILDSLDENTRETYINIIKEELDYNLLIKLGCPESKIEILLYNLVPFINYNNLKLSWLLSLEIKFIILKFLKNKINMKELKKELIKNIYENYINKKIVEESLMEIIVSQWLNKIKV
jgi:hypothetical protein